MGLLHQTAELLAKGCDEKALKRHGLGRFRCGVATFCITPFRPEAGPKAGGPETMTDDRLNQRLLDAVDAGFDEEIRFLADITRIPAGT